MAKQIAEFPDAGAVGPEDYYLVQQGDTGTPLARITHEDLTFLLVRKDTLGKASGTATLDAAGQLTAAQIPSAFISGITPLGTWDADTNTPTLASSVGTVGDMWAVSVAGSTNLDGETAWSVGDQALFTGGAWSRIPFSTAMASVALSSLASIGFSDGTTITTRNILVPGLVQTWTREGDIAGAIRENGELWFSQARFVNVTVTDGTFTDVTATTADIATATIDDAIILDAEIAGITHAQRSLVPAWVHQWQDPDGNTAAGVRLDGEFVIARAKVTNLEVDTLTMTDVDGGGAVNSIVAGNALVPNLSHYEADTAGNVARAVTLTGRSLELPRPAIIARAMHQVARPTMVHSYTAPRTSADASLTSGTTIATLWSMDLPFDWIRIIGGQQAGGAGIMSAICAPTANPSDGVNPVYDNGDPVSWTTVGWNNPGTLAHTPWTQATGATTSVTLATGSGTEIWGMTASDWMQVPSLPRSDSGAFPLLMVRVYLTGSPVAVSLTPVSAWAGLTPAGYAFGRSWGAYQATGDYVSSTGSFPTSGTTWGNYWAPLIVQTYSRGLGFQLWGVGDSNMAGTGSPNGLMGFYRRASLAMSRRFPTICSNFNQGGSDPLTYMSNPSTILDAVRPSGLVMFPFSFNGGASTREKLEADWSRGMVLAERTLSHGGVPILMGYPPRAGMTAEQDGMRLESLERIDAAMLTGMRGVNTNSVIAVSGSPETWAPGMSDDVEMHYSGIGHAIVGDALIPQLAEAFGIY